MDEEIIIREATMEDINDVMRILFDDDRARKKDQYIDPLPECYREAYSFILNDPNDIILVACKGNKVIGTSQLRFKRHLARHGAFRATIEAVRIDKNERSQGVGTKLIKYSIETAKEKKCSLIELTSHISRTRAHSFYKRLGFESTHVGMEMELI
ncbi:MAG: GNAT family N-acetyltransferase [Coprobacillus sp.]